MKKNLSELLDNFPFPFDAKGFINNPISGISLDSRSINPGDLFVAMKGGSSDGHQFIEQAIHKGAAAVIGEKPGKEYSVPYIRVDDSRKSATWLSAAFYEFPGKKLFVIGVTGTDGKTTTCNLIYKILLASGLRAGLISTVNAIIGEELIDTGFHVTTPDAPEIQEILAKMVEKEITHVVLETTSHGLAQHRADAAFFDVGVITNITHEHLDQHGSFAGYRKAKGRLLELLGETPLKNAGNSRLSVLNFDDDSFEYLSGITSGPVISYGLDSKSDVRAENLKYALEGTSFDVKGPGFSFTVESQLMGEHNIYNCLAAVCVGKVGLRMGEKEISEGIFSMDGIPGRMEKIELGQTFTAMVDFAHTPNALRVAISTLQKYNFNKILLIIGSAGLRDIKKRYLMGKISAQVADLTFFTAEDPRTEELNNILEEMSRGAETGGGVKNIDYFCVPDRGEAIRKAVQLAHKGDVVIACGKGHEQSMCFGTVEYPWDDRTAMKAAISELLNIPGPKMPFLPTQEND